MTDEAQDEIVVYLRREHPRGSAKIDGGYAMGVLVGRQRLLDAADEIERLRHKLREKSTALVLCRDRHQSKDAEIERLREEVAAVTHDRDNGFKIYGAHLAAQSAVNADIVERLREISEAFCDELGDDDYMRVDTLEAADEIERLRSELKSRMVENERLVEGLYDHEAELERLRALLKYLEDGG